MFIYIFFAKLFRFSSSYSFVSIQNWIDPNKPLLKYVAKDDRQNCKLQFRVKFYVTDASQLIEDDTRHQFYLQIRHDIYNKQLECPLSTQSLLASYVVQGKSKRNLNKLVEEIFIYLFIARTFTA